RAVARAHLGPAGGCKARGQQLVPVLSCLGEQEAEVVPIHVSLISDYLGRLSASSARERHAPVSDPLFQITCVTYGSSIRSGSLKRRSERARRSRVVPAQAARRARGDAIAR